MGNADTKPVRLKILPGKYAVCRTDTDEQVAVQKALTGSFWSVTKTNEETSVVCEEDEVCSHWQSEKGWKGIRVEGTLDFSLTGILAGLVNPLKDAGIPVFVISTYNTDCVFVKEDLMAKAMSVLNAAGYLLL